MNHPNIVSYKSAWLEPFVGEYASSGDETHTSPSLSQPSSNPTSSFLSTSSVLRSSAPATESSFSVQFCGSDLGSNLSFNDNYTVSYEDDSLGADPFFGGNSSKSGGKISAVDNDFQVEKERGTCPSIEINGWKDILIFDFFYNYRTLSFFNEKAFIEYLNSVVVSGSCIHTKKFRIVKKV